MSAILGMRGSGDFGVDGERAESWDEKIIWLYPNIAKLTAMLSMLPKRKAVTDARFHYYEEDLPIQRLRINNGAGYASGVTTLTVDTENTSTPVAGALQVRKGIVLWNERSGERMYVVDDPVADTQIQVIRGFGSTAAAAINDNDWLTIIGSAHGEGNDVPTAVGYNPTHIENLTQIFRNSWTLSGSAITTEFRTGDVYKNARRRASVDYLTQQEMAFLFGEYKETTDPVSGLPLTQTRGIVSHINSYASDNIISSVGALSESAWDGYLEQISPYGMFENKIALCGSGALKVLTDMAKGGNIRMESHPKSETYGMAIKKYVTSFGDLNIAQHPLFSRHPVLKYNILIVDSEFVAEAPKKGRDTKVLKDRQGNGVDGKTDEFMCEKGIQVKNAKAHFYMTGITSFAP